MEQFLKESGFIIESATGQNCVGSFKFAGNVIRVISLGMVGYKGNKVKVRVIIDGLKWSTTVNPERLEEVVKAAFKLINWTQSP